MAAEFVRVRLASGVEKSLPARTAKIGGFTVIDEPALDSKGKVVPPRRATAQPVEAEQAPAEDAPEPMTAMRVSDLKAEIDKRNEGRDEASLIPNTGKKADLVAALEADDKR